MAVFMPVSVKGVGVFEQAFAKGIAVNAQGIGGFGKIIVMAAEHFKDEVFFKLLHGLVKENATSDHLVNNRFKFGFHRLPSVWNARRDSLNCLSGNIIYRATTARCGALDRIRREKDLSGES